MTPASHDTQRHRDGLVFIISAPSGGGKTSLVAELLRQDSNLVVSVSHTTRKRRPSEKNGIDYHFINTEMFAGMARKREFLEHAKVFGNQYGTSKGAVGDELDQGRDVILEIDWQGARLIRGEYPEAISIFILPPSRKTLAARLKRRAQDDPAVIAERTNQATVEMAHYADYDYLLVNDDFTTAAAELMVIVRAARLATTPQRQVLKDLLAELLLKDS